MRKIAFLVLSSILFSASAAPVHAMTLSDAELSGVIQVISYDNIHDDYYYMGTGFFVNYTSGCFLTATHAVIGDDDEFRDIIYAVFNAGTDSEEFYLAQPIIGYIDSDISLLCISDDTFEKRFTHFFPLATDTMDDLIVGDSLTGFGYPVASGSTVTAVFGQVTGFLPWVEERDYIKSDVDISGGISGAPVLADDKTIVGMLVARNEDEGDMETAYAVSADVIGRVGNEAGDAIMEMFEGTDSAVPEGCELNEETGSYDLDGNEYYDAFCSAEVDTTKENLLKAQYEHWCGETPHHDYLTSGVSALADGELTLNDWRAYLNNLCGEEDTESIYNYATPEQTLGARLIKSAEFSAVYAVLADGKRHAFPTQAVYESWYGEDFSEIETVSSEELASYRIGENVTFQPGSLIKIPSIAKVYMVADEGELRWMVDEDTAVSLHGSEWAKSVHDVSEAFFMNYAGVGEEIQL